MHSPNKKKFSFWPYIIIGMLSCTGVINYLLVYYSNSVYSKPVSASPYNDALKYDEKARELQCGKDRGYSFKIVTNGDFQEIKVTGSPLPIDKFTVKGWSGTESVVEEELILERTSSRARLKTKLSLGLWNMEVFGLGGEASCAWRVVVQDVV